MRVVVVSARPLMRRFRLNTQNAQSRVHLGAFIADLVEVGEDERVRRFENIRIIKSKLLR